MYNSCQFRSKIINKPFGNSSAGGLLLKYGITKKEGKTKKGKEREIGKSQPQRAKEMK